MSIIKLYGKHEFVTHGVWVNKGRKKAPLKSAEIDKFMQDYKTTDAKIDIFSSKRSDRGMFISLSVDVKSASNGAVLSVERNSDMNTFNVIFSGHFALTLSDTEESMLFYNGQQIQDLEFSIMGISFGNLLEGGGVSRIDNWEKEIDDPIFPKIEFEYCS